MRAITITIAVLLAALHVASAQSAADLCAGCKMVNGAGYNSHPTDCDKFVHCHYDTSGALYGEVQQCSFSTYWNADLLTCTLAKNTKCPMDKCIGLPDGTIFAADGNCRGFWECRNEKALAKCCARGRNWNDIDGLCMDNTDDYECNDMCYNEEDETPCDKEAVPGKPNFFRQQVQGLFWVQMPCAPGSVFVQDMCVCGALAPIVPVTPTCQRELYLPFTTNAFDQSGKGQYVRVENVEVVDGVARFNGNNSRLIIPRFTNVQGAKTVIIRVRYTSDHVTSPEEHAIVSNSDCGNTPSILISEDGLNTNFGVGTDHYTFQIVSLPQAELPLGQTRSVKDLLYTFDNGRLTATNGDETRYVEATGSLRNVQCGLHIGDADKMAPFKGEIDEVEVYLCNPLF